jgi:hypothetical protein
LVLDVSSNNLTQGAETFYNSGNHRGYETDITGACCNCLLPLTEIAAVVGIIALADAIPDMGALSLLNLANNNIGGASLPAGWKDVQLADKSWEYQHADGRTQKDGIDEKSFGLITIADAIKNMGAISSVNLLKNDVGVEQAGALVIILKEHPTLKSLCGNKGYETKLDMSGKMDSAADAIMLAAEIDDNRAISSVNLLKNVTPVEQAQELVKIMQSKEKLTTLCGLSGNEATLDFSNQGLGPGDALLIANDISDMRALIKLDISSNHIGDEQERGLQRICVTGGIELAK